jgi:hypothetical protein
LFNHFPFISKQTIFHPTSRIPYITHPCTPLLFSAQLTVVPSYPVVTKSSPITCTTPYFICCLFKEQPPTNQTAIHCSYITTLLSLYMYAIYHAPSTDQNNAI